MATSADPTCGCVLGTTLLLIATDAYQKYQQATQAVFDNDVGLLSLTLRNFATLQTLHFMIGDVSPYLFGKIAVKH